MSRLQQLNRDVVEAVLQSHPVFCPDQHLYVNVVRDQAHVTWHAFDGMKPRAGSRLELHIIGETCYLLGIALAHRYRGVGLGRRLYRCAEAIALLAGCRRLQQTPSGRTAGGETRAEYIARKLGYVMHDGQGIKDLWAD